MLSSRGNRRNLWQSEAFTRLFQGLSEIYQPSHVLHMFPKPGSGVQSGKIDGVRGVL